MKLRKLFKVEGTSPFINIKFCLEFVFRKLVG